MKKLSVTKNYIYNVLYDLLVMIVPIVTTPYISRVLSVESIGLYSYTYSIVMYFTAFVVLGTKSYAIKLISRSNDKYSTSVIFWNVFSIRLISGILALVTYVVIIFFTAKNITVSLIQGIYIIGVIFDISWFFQGLENFRTIVLRNFIVKVISLIMIFGFVKDNDDLLIYIISLSLLTVVGNLSLWGYLPSCLVKVKLSNINPFMGFKEILVLFIPTLALQVYSATDKIMLGNFTKNLTQNGYYEQTNKIVMAALSVITSLGIVVLPRVSALFAQKDFKRINECMNLSYRFVLFLSIPMVVGLCAVSNIFIPWFLGQGYQECVILICIMSLLLIIIGLSNITGFQYLVATDRQNYYSFSIIMGTLLNIVLNVILIPKYFALGATIATVLSELVILFIQAVYVSAIKKEFSFLKIILQSWKYVLSSGIMFTTISAIKTLRLRGFWGVFVCVIIGIVTYVSFVIILKDRMVLDYLKKYREKTFRKK